MPSRRELANAIRALSMDAVQRANSGHPGAPMGMADIAEVLWNDFLRHNPNNPNWHNRDRFIMSNGHGSMLLYSILHLCGYDLSIDEIKNFRRLRSKTPGHPEYGHAPGIEATTGPLGQGLANAVGMAIAERTLAARFNRDNFNIIDHYTYFSVGDGCLMEGISHEACSLAGTLKLGKLIGIFDNNRISIDGDVRGWFTDDTARRFESYGWHVIDNVDGHDAGRIKAAITSALAEKNCPSLICCNTIIGWGSPNKQGKAESHGASLGEEEVELTRQALGWKFRPFEIPAAYYQGWDARQKGQQLEGDWNNLFSEYKNSYPQQAAEFLRRMGMELPGGWTKTTTAYIDAAFEKPENMATRKASQQALNVYGPILPELIGGSADLSGSNLTRWSGSQTLSAESPDGNYIYYGVREFAMAAINNGIALHGGFIPYGGTFLMFSEYARNALRMAAMMRLRNVFVFTHDSIGLGEDGPTHQPVEQAATLRFIPNMSLWRPCDTVETAVAWRMAIERRDGPTALLFSRQNLLQVPRSREQMQRIDCGAYTLTCDDAEPELIIISTGSEVCLAYNVAVKLIEQGRKVRAISMPSTDVFDRQTQDYKDSVLTPACRKRIAIEAGIKDYWRKYVGLEGEVVGLDTFGESAPADDVYKHFDITEDRLMSLALDILD